MKIENINKMKKVLETIVNDVWSVYDGILPENDKDILESLLEDPPEYKDLRNSWYRHVTMARRVLAEIDADEKNTVNFECEQGYSKRESYD